MKISPFRKEKKKRVISDLEIHEQRLLSFSVVSGLWMSGLFPSTLPRLFLKPYLMVPFLVRTVMVIARTRENLTAMP